MVGAPLLALSPLQMSGIALALTSQVASTLVAALASCESIQTNEASVAAQVGEKHRREPTNDINKIPVSCHPAMGFPRPPATATAQHDSR